MCAVHALRSMAQRQAGLSGRLPDRNGSRQESALPAQHGGNAPAQGGMQRARNAELLPRRFLSRTLAAAPIARELRLEADRGQTPSGGTTRNDRAARPPA